MQDLKPWIIPAAIAGGVSFGVGVIVGYNLRRKEANATAIYAGQLEHKLDCTEEEIRGLEAKLEAATIAEGQRKVVAYHEIVPSEAAQDAPNVTVNVFNDGDWNWEEENEERTTDAPYTLHISEWEHEEKGYRQHTLTWYAADKVLVDEHNVPIQNPERLVGHLNFGHGSDDPNIVYIRNDKHQGEYEVIRDPGSYALEVLGGEVEDHLMEEAELKHSHRVPKFRLD